MRDEKISKKIAVKCSSTFSSSLILLSLILSSFIPTSAHAVPLIRDAEIESTLRTYADPIFRTAGLKPKAIRIFLVNDDSINAFVAGGANMFIHAGLILEADNPGVLIGVMAHETGHISGGHLAQGTEKLKDAQIGTILTYVLGAAAAVATKKPEAAAAVIGGGSSTVARNFLAYTRANEEAADQAALRYLDDLGISSSGLLQTLLLLQRNERLHSNRPDPYLLTHPLSSSRIEHVRNHIENSKIPEGSYPSSYNLIHKRMVAKLYSFMESPERTFLKYPVSDKSVPARLAHAVAYYKMPDLVRSLEKMDSLLAEAPNDAFLHELKGQILFENGKIPEALVSYKKAVQLYPSSALILTELAKVELAQSDDMANSAISHLEKANSIDNSNSITWRLLATAYGKKGNLGMSYLALAEEAMLADSHDAAIKQADLALQALKAGTPAHLRAQDVKARANEIKRKKDESNSTL
ncbi:MAG: M48 family metalloprotease [Alphaproteobacteria bacterium]